MSELAVAAAAVVPALFLGVSGAALLATRSRLTAVLMLITALGLIGSAAARLLGSASTAQVILAGSLMLPGAMAVLAYPRAGFGHAVDFCTWTIVLGAGAIGTVLALDLGTSGSLAAVIFLALVGHAWWVLEIGDELDRLAILWLALAVMISGSIFCLLLLEWDAAGAVAGALLFSAVGPAMVVGVRRPGLTDVRSLVVQVVVFGVVGLTYVSLFVAVMSILESVGAPTTGVLALLGLLLAVGFHPLRVVLRGLIDELLFGDRPDPLLAATTVADQIGDDPLLALRAIRAALVLPYASITAGGIELATSGTPVTETRRLPLSLGNDTVGEIIIGLRPGDLTLSADDEQVLGIVGPLLAQTLRSRRLAEDLKESRATAITAIEEERRRLRRDLHDGLGPTLSGIALTADAARNTIHTDPSAADALLLRLRADAGAAVGAIRRLVYDMRPPALDELGLVPALRQQVATTRTPQGQPMRVQVDAVHLPPLPAAVEVAAFRIATEAVINSARHSGTDRAWVRLEGSEEVLEVTIRDAGCGRSGWVPGVGMSSMRERAAEVGGTLQVTVGADGALVKARLPVG